MRAASLGAEAEGARALVHHDAPPVLRTDVATVSKSSGLSDRRSMTSTSRRRSAAISAASSAVADQAAVGHDGDVVARARIAARPIGSARRAVVSTIARVQ